MYSYKMPTKGPKLWLTTSRIRNIYVVTFLMLSAVAVASGGNFTRKCYWCGPIAEQVNRKEVAPPCETENLIVFTCQEGHNYCAIAASSPPYVESRFCSKVYQDECYPQYCNSTKKWRMTCACRGDLCNENITKRELDAFAKLSREVEAKESRVKRNTKGANVILPDTEKTIIITNISTLTNDDKVSSSEHNDQATQVILQDQILSVQVIAKDEDVVTTASITNESNEHDEDNDDVVKIDKTSENNYSAQATTVSHMQSDEVKESNKIEVPEATITGILLSKVLIGTTIVTKPKEALNTSTARPSEKLPTAEALRQDASSENDDNNTEHTTGDFEPTEASTSESDDNDGNDDEVDHHVTGEPGDSNENSANTHTSHVLLLINGLLLQYIYNSK